MNAQRGREPSTPPTSVTAVVRFVHRSLAWARAVEGALFLAAGVLATRWAMLLSPAGLEASAELDGLALAAGFLAALTWGLEHRATRAETARSLDRRLRYHGALVTAYELELREPPAQASGLNALERLVCLRVLERLRTSAALRSMLPPLFPPLAAPTLAALLWLTAVEERRAPAPPAVDLSALAERFERALAWRASDAESDGDADRDADRDGTAPRLRAEDRARLLGVRSELPYSPAGWSREPEATRARLAEIDGELARLAAGLLPEDPERAHLEEARTWLDALRMALEQGSAGSSAAGDSAGAPGSTGRGLTSGGVDGTISPPLPLMSSAAHDRTSSEGTAPLGLAAGTWWPSEYDEVVARWIESSRALSGQR